MTGTEILQSIIDGHLPQAPMSKLLSFWITAVGDGVAVFEGNTSSHLLNPMAPFMEMIWASTRLLLRGIFLAHI
jgi:hypothetical protein